MKTLFQAFALVAVLFVIPHFIVELIMEYAPMVGLIAVIAFILFVVIATYKVIRDEMSDL